MTPVIGDAIEGILKNTVGKVVGGLVDKYLPASMTEQEKAAVMAEAEKQALETFKAEVADTQSARSREVEMNKAEGASRLSKDLTSYLAIGCLLLSFLLFYQLLWIGVSPDKKDILVYILGIMSAIDMSIISYYFGSSSGSAHKTGIIDRMMK